MLGSASLKVNDWSDGKTSDKRKILLQMFKHPFPFHHIKKIFIVCYFNICNIDNIHFFIVDELLKIIIFISNIKNSIKINLKKCLSLYSHFLLDIP